jgi:ribosomal protein L12E/L44/L45/RPP1/RPP2
MWEEKNKSEIACILAGLILNENNITISELNIKNIFFSADVKTENYWPSLFERLSKTFKMENTIGFSNLNKVLIPKEEKEEKEEKIFDKQEATSSTPKESDEDMGFGLFD